MSRNTLRVPENKLDLRENKWRPKDWGKLRNQELAVVYSSPDIVKVIKMKQLVMAGHESQIGVMKNAYHFGCKTRWEETTRET